MLMRLFLGVVVCVCALLFAQGLFLRFTGRETPDENSLPQMVVATSSMHGAILFMVWLTLRREHISWSQAFGFSRAGAGRAILFGVLTALAFIPVGMLLQAFSASTLQRFHINAPLQQAVESLQHAKTLPVQIYLGFFAVVLAPVAEEILFRGVIYPTVKQSGFPRAALWGTSLAFALIHGNLPILLPLLVLALALALLYEKTDNLLGPIAAHSTFNAYNVALLFKETLGKHHG